ncbi:MAG: serine/threonine protein kinase [Planctomycetota bacterium]|nr:MAG: serine/threonine protein kinase [Planctomycetota bacterium]
MPEAACPRCRQPVPTQGTRGDSAVCPKCALQFLLDDGAFMAPTQIADAPLAAGTIFQGLRIEAVVGRGGMGVVYAALQANLGRKVALKLLSPSLAADPDFVERFQREAQALASLSHPGIVGIHEFGFEDGRPFLVMEFVEGVNLRSLLRDKRMAPAEALRLVPQICDALEYAHGRGVVHRDIKPENILVTADGRVKIADFGLAKLADAQSSLTRSDVVMGTPHYMAPEQVENPKSVDHRADIYALGVVFYEMLTGELPLGRFAAPSTKADVDEHLDRIVMKSLEKEPGKRFQHASEVSQALKEAPEAKKAKLPLDQRIVLNLIALAFVAGAWYLVNQLSGSSTNDRYGFVIGIPVCIAGAFYFAAHLRKRDCPESAIATLGGATAILAWVMLTPYAVYDEVRVWKMKRTAPGLAHATAKEVEAGMGPPQQRQRAGTLGERWYYGRRHPGQGDTTYDLVLESTPGRYVAAFEISPDGKVTRYWVPK